MPKVKGDARADIKNNADVKENSMNGQDQTMTDKWEENISDYFSSKEVDALGEIGNICIGNSATTMYALIGHKVTITTPNVKVVKANRLFEPYNDKFMVINVEFISGVRGKNLLLVRDYDAALITDLLMGGEGKIDENNVVLDELQFSAMSEVMNQMMGTAATTMSSMVGLTINISPPYVTKIDYDEDVSKLLDGASHLVLISFDMKIEGLLDSKLLQVMTIDMAKTLINTLTSIGDDMKNDNDDSKKVEPRSVNATKKEDTSGDARATNQRRPVKAIKKPEFESFDDTDDMLDDAMDSKNAKNTELANFNLINDIPLQVTVELGKTKKSLNDVLNFTTGSIIVLDKQAGDLVEVIVNGKKIARGEVVVVDENYGVRITELIKG